MHVRIFNPIQRAVSLVLLLLHILPVRTAVFINPPENVEFPPRFFLGNRYLIQWRAEHGFSDLLTVQIRHWSLATMSDVEIGNVIKDIECTPDWYFEEWWYIGDNDNINYSVISAGPEFSLSLRRSGDPTWRHDSVRFIIEGNQSDSTAYTTSTTEVPSLQTSHDIVVLDNRPLKVEIGLGVGLGIPALAVLGIVTTKFLMRRRKKAKRKDACVENAQTNDVAELDSTITASLSAHELAANKKYPVHELAENKDPAHEFATKNHDSVLTELPAEPVAQEEEGEVSEPLGRTSREEVATK
ncbi:hypothetical protein QBC41DRAFT_383979 [Cercophora samala]|uniref:Uncharacterized protein n=1 Tax=Cercophora samala TaxID=330535 RepID=A0AA40DF45_9PEZI|nr:hypothetical protein QBC41DRAFT_383979 [Cercophora samala]